MDGVGGPVAKGQGDERSEGARTAETRQRGDVPAGVENASGIDGSAPATHDRSGTAGEGPNEIGAHDLRTIRQQLGLSAAQLATIAGVSEVELAEMEEGRRPVPPTLLAELMEQLNAKGA